MYTSFNSVALSTRPLIEAIDKVADAGYAAIELNAETLPWAEAHVTPETTATDRRAIVEACACRGLKISSVGAHIDMVSTDKAAREAAIAFVNGCAELAADVGAPVVHILSGADSGGGDDSWRWFADAVAATTTHAGRRGVRLGIEAIVGQVFHKVDDYHRLARDLPGVPFGINFDPSHLVVQGENPIRIVDELGNRIAHVHIKDGMGCFPDFSFPPVGQGVVDFKTLINGLERIGYDGALSVEYEAQVFGFKETEDTILNTGICLLEQFGIARRRPS